MRITLRGLKRESPFTILLIGTLLAHTLDAAGGLVETLILPTWDARQERIEAEKERITKLERENQLLRWYVSGEPQQLAQGMGPFPLNN